MCEVIDLMTDGKCKEKVGNAFQPKTVQLGGKKIFAQKLDCADRTTLKRCERLKKSKEEEEEEEEIEILMSHLCSSQSEILRIWDCFFIWSRSCGLFFVFVVWLFDG